jgi:hypothetical protein
MEHGNGLKEYFCLYRNEPVFIIRLQPIPKILTGIAIAAIPGGEKEEARHI